MLGHSRLGHALILVIGLLVVGGVHSVATADADPVTCESLKTTLSGDKNYYIFEAKATGNASSISGYTFDFGDHQSYTFTFKPNATEDHHTATVTHTYQKTGTYKPTVHVVLKNGQKTTNVTSDACKTTITIEPAPDILPDTGSHVPVLPVVTGTFIGSTVLHYLFRRWRLLE